MMHLVPDTLQHVQCPTCKTTTTAYVETSIDIELPPDNGGTEHLRITVKPAMVVCTACGTTLAPMDPPEETTT